MLNRSQDSEQKLTLHDESTLLQVLRKNEYPPQQLLQGDYQACPSFVLVDFEGMSLKLCLCHAKTVKDLHDSALSLYSRLIEQLLADTHEPSDHRTRSSTNKAVRKKVMVALATKNNNECLDQFLAHSHKSLKDLQPGEHLVAVFSKRPKSQENDLGSYEKIKIIGKGGFAEKVYLARHKESGGLVAIKTISKQFILQEQGRYNQVFSELKVMQQLLEHPFVIKLQRAFASKDDLHLVVDFCAGGELFYLL